MLDVGSTYDQMVLLTVPPPIFAASIPDSREAFAMLLHVFDEQLIVTPDSDPATELAGTFVRPAAEP